MEEEMHSGFLDGVDGYADHCAKGCSGLVVIGNFSALLFPNKGERLRAGVAGTRGSALEKFLFLNFFLIASSDLT